MKSWKTPTPDDIARAVALLRSEQHRRRFFDRLQNPRWLVPLHESGLFNEPPIPVRNEEEGTVRYPPWPQSRYLARMAEHDPQTVVGIIRTIEVDGNVSIYEDFVDAVLAVPIEQATWVVDRVDAWLKPAFLFRLPSKLGTLISKLAEGGQVADAIGLATILLAVSAEGDGTVEKRPSALGPEPRIRIDHEEYEQILGKHIPGLVIAAPEQTLLLLCDLLASATMYSRQVEYRDEVEDGSYVWCPSIKDCGPGSHPELLAVLTASVRDAAAKWAAADTSRVREIIKIYDSNPWRVFERLSYHLLWDFSDSAMDLVTLRLTDRARFGVFSTRFEYERLAECCFAKLASDDQDKILSWIEKGPDLIAYADSAEQLHGKRPTEDECQEFAESWRRDRLAPISDALPADWGKRYAKLVEQYGEASREPFRAISVGSWNPKGSPITSEELSSKTVVDLVAFLNSWQQTDQYHGPTYEGLVDTLTKVVTEQPERFLDAWEEFKGVSPRYIYALLEGFRKALKTTWQDDWWATALAACQWAGDQPGTLAGEDLEQETRREPTWTWVAHSIVALLSAGFEGDDHPIPLAHREQAWGVLEPITSHPDPTLRIEAEEQDCSNMDYLTSSLNCVRGQAMHAVIHYALWLRRRWAESDSHKELMANGLDAMPEVQKVLESHLDPARDSSLAIRAIYGQWFPWLCLLDQQWATERAAIIFTQDRQQDSLWAAAWSSYISYCPAYNDVLRVLRLSYLVAIEKLQDGEFENEHFRGPAHRLAEHIMTYYGRGVLSVQDDLIEQFFSTAPAPIRGRAIEFVGWSLGEEGDLPEEVLERFRTLWESRAGAARASEADQRRDPELVAFGLWFSSGKFDPAWALAQLRDALASCGWAERSHEVVEQLALVANVNPGVSIECVSYLVDGDTQGWTIHSWRESLRAIFGIGLGSEDAEVYAATRKLINRLGERGFDGFEDLL